MTAGVRRQGLVATAQLRPTSCSSQQPAPPSGSPLTRSTDGPFPSKPSVRGAQRVRPPTSAPNPRPVKSLGGVRSGSRRRASLRAVQAAQPSSGERPRHPTNGLARHGTFDVPPRRPLSLADDAEVCGGVCLPREARHYDGQLSRLPIERQVAQLPLAAEQAANARRDGAAGRGGHGPFYKAKTGPLRSF